MRLVQVATLACFAVGAALFPSQVMAQAKIGKTLDEIIALAKKEPPVQIATTWEGEIIELSKRGLMEKYGLSLKLEYSNGLDDRERILNEALTGRVENDLVNVSGDLRDKFIKSGVIVPVDWAALFPQISRDIISPDGYYLGTGMNQFVLAYNTKLVSDADAPKNWQDCLDPKWKGKVAVYTRPLSFVQVYFKWGPEKSKEFLTALKNQNPIWVANINSSVSLLAAGEYPILCGINYYAIKTILRDDPKAPIAVSVPKLFPYQVGEALAVMKSSRSPNSAILLAGYLATDGQRAYDVFGRSNPAHEGTDAWALAKAADATPYWAGWAFDGAKQTAATKAIVSAWGFPKGR